MDANEALTRDGPIRSVITLNQPEFEAACASLMRMVMADYEPTLLVGIRTGGLVVAEAMARSLSRPMVVLPLTCRRPGTATKSRLPFLHEVLGTLPRGVVDAMRIVEHRLLTSRRKRSSKAPSVDHDEAAAIAALLAERTDQHRLLVVDDAVDSGATLAAVMELLRSSCPSRTEICTAVITVTLDSPRIMPDFVLHHRVLCRFPWSFDAAR
jgi:hypoxanthine phosphoribosyltransferase